MNTELVSRQEEFVKKFASLLEPGLYSDIEITAGSNTFKAHRAIIDIRTNCFAKIALNGKCTIRKHSGAAVHCFLQYCYTGDYTTDAAKADKSCEQYEAALHVNVYHLEKMMKVDGLGCLAAQKYGEYWTRRGAARRALELDIDDLQRLTDEERKEFLKDVKDVWGRATVREREVDKLVDAMLELVHDKQAELKGVAEYRTMLKELDGFAATLCDYFRVVLKVFIQVPAASELSR